MGDWKDFLSEIKVNKEQKSKILKGRNDSMDGKIKLQRIFGHIPDSIWPVSHGTKLDISERTQDKVSEDHKNDTLKIFDNSTRNKNVRWKGALSIFPITILNQLLEFYTEKGDTFFDPFAGHSSRMEGAFKKGRHYIGYDISHEFMEFNRGVAKVLLKNNPEKLTITLKEQDSRTIDDPDNSVDFIFSSPPYWCLIPDTKIVTPNGIKLIKDINIKDKVLTHKGRFKNVLGVSNKKIKDNILKIHTKNNTEPITLTKNHKMFACKKIKHPYYNNRAYRPDDSYERMAIKKGWTPLKLKGLSNKFKPSFILPTDLEKGDWLVYPINRQEKNMDNIDIKQFIDLNKKYKRFTPFVKDGFIYLQPNQYGINKIKEYIKVDKYLMKLIGYYLAEGDSSKSSISFTFNKHEREYIDDVKYLLKKCFGITHIKEYNYNNAISVRCYSTPISSFLKYFCGKCAVNKFIYKDFMTLPLSLQKELIKGLWRGDGCSFTQGFQYTTVSPSLNESIKQILFRFDIVSSSKFKSSHIGKFIDRIITRHDTYGLSIIDKKGIQKMCNILNESHKKENIGQEYSSSSFIYEDYAYFEIRHVEEISYNGYVYNMEVDDDNSYTTNICNVHNCIEFYGDEPEQLGKLSYEDFMKGMTDVYKQCYRVLKPGKFCIMNVNDFRLNGKYYSYHTDTINAMKEAGFTQYDLVIMKYQNAMRKCFPNQILQEKLLPKTHEFIIVFYKEPEYEHSAVYPFKEKSKVKK